MATRTQPTTVVLVAAVVLGLFSGAVLFGSGRSFVLATSLSGFAFLAALNVVSPDALIARVNLARAEAGKPLDTTHISSLSDDALPLILNRMSVLDEQSRCDMLVRLNARRSNLTTGWTGWNLGRFRATRAMQRAPVSESLAMCGPLSHRTAESPR